MKQASSSGNLFNLLPQDILSHLLLFLDIPSIGALAQTSKPQSGSVSQLAISEKTWLNIVNRRFNVFTSSRGVTSCRPKLYGGPTWKDAYRSMASCNRIPKMRVLFKKKNVFAKGAGYLTEHNNQSEKPPRNGEVFQSGDTSNSSCLMAKPEMNREKIEVDRIVQKRRREQFVSSWVMINHTEDCNLRFTSSNVDDQTHLFGRYMSQTPQRRTINSRPTPYIELQLAFQNTKSGFCKVNVDVSKTTVQMRCQHGQDNVSTLTQRIIKHGPLKPKIIYRSIGNEVLYQENGMKSNRRSFSNFRDSEARDDTLGGIVTSHGLKRRSMTFHTLSSLTSCPISLRPFEFIIISVNVPMSDYMTSEENVRFETDFLSRAISLSTPVTLHCDKDHSKRSSGEKSPTDYNSCRVYSSLSVATFLKENDIWENYMQLPGNCLALTDNSAHLSV